MANREREPMNPGTVYSGDNLCPGCGGTGNVTKPVGGTWGSGLSPF